MNLEKKKLANNSMVVTPLSYNSMNGNNTTSSVNLFSSNASSTNDITAGDLLKSHESDKHKDNRTLLR